MKKETRNQNAVVGASGVGDTRQEALLQEKGLGEREVEAEPQGPLVFRFMQGQMSYSLGSKVRWGMERKGDCKLAVALM